MRRFILPGFGILFLTALILALRCANYQEVFVRGNVYFADADCYARMSRARICAGHPGTIVRHHDFENFPRGTAPHTTAPLDYLIVAVSILLKPLTSRPFDLAGAIVSPLLALIGGVFLWWWSRRMKLPYPWATLILYAVSPILVHGTELGRPDHQSLLIVLMAIAICAEWSLQTERTRNWSVVSGIAWGLAMWVSFYEPLILLAVVLFAGLTKDRQRLFGLHRRIGWIIFAAILVAAFLIERRVPSFSIFQSNTYLQNWSRTIGELAHVSVASRIWFVWAGYMIALAPILIWIALRKKIAPPSFVLVLLVATFLLTIWQARWAYFFILIFAIALPWWLSSIKSFATVWTAFALSILPVLQFWDAQLWPNESELARRIERQNESVQLRELATTIRSAQPHAFLAPWWLSPAIAYWSGQAGVAGSSHESLGGILDSARMFTAADPEIAREILRRRQVEWVFAYDWERVKSNSAELLGSPITDAAFGRILDRSPSHASGFLLLSGQNGVGKLFRFTDKL